MNLCCPEEIPFCIGLIDRAQLKRLPEPLANSGCG
jgi:hypothetical protein